ncbi:MAG: diaminopimelate decarboxylase, partial [Gammaproteobacteria bacterium]|nr:diaminopimelate decarboxylase [Gammaproteobacteria bacterium]
KTDDELLRAILSEAKINCDHEEEVWRIEQMAKQHKRMVNIGIRLCFDIGLKWNRFGFSLACVDDIVNKIIASPHLTLSGIHAHIGTNIRDIEQFAKLGVALSDFAEHLLRDNNIRLKWIDVGGGLAGISPRKDEEIVSAHPLPDVIQYAKAIIHPLKGYLQHSPTTQLIFEPGRTLFEPYGALLTKIFATRSEKADHQEVICDAGINTLSTSYVYDHPLHIMTAEQRGEQRRTKLLGPTCNQVDQLYDEVMLPSLKTGDYALFYGVGAYCMAFSFSFIRFRPGVVLWQGADDACWLRQHENLEHISQLETII